MQFYAPKPANAPKHETHKKPKVKYLRLFMYSQSLVCRAWVHEFWNVNHGISAAGHHLWQNAVPLG